MLLHASNEKSVPTLQFFDTSILSPNQRLVILGRLTKVDTNFYLFGDLFLSYNNLPEGYFM